MRRTSASVMVLRSVMPSEAVTMDAVVQAMPFCVKIAL